MMDVHLFIRQARRQIFAVIKTDRIKVRTTLNVKLDPMVKSAFVFVVDHFVIRFVAVYAAPSQIHRVVCHDLRTARGHYTTRYD